MKKVFLQSRNLKHECYFKTIINQTLYLFLFSFGSRLTLSECVWYELLYTFFLFSIFNLFLIHIIHRMDHIIKIMTKNDVCLHSPKLLYITFLDIEKYIFLFYSCMFYFCKMYPTTWLKWIHMFTQVKSHTSHLSYSMCDFTKAVGGKVYEIKY